MAAKMIYLWAVIAFAVPALANTGTDFSNNLFSDLAPLIALFGEQVSKQFLSQSLGLADAILFAMAPLGIITGVVSAIRLSGYTWLKAIVGRSSETKGAAGLELTAATSNDICELWDGKSAVRIMGKPAILSVAFTKADLIRADVQRYAYREPEPEPELELDLLLPRSNWDSNSNMDNEDVSEDEDTPEISDIVASKGSILSFDEARDQGWFNGNVRRELPPPQRDGRGGGSGWDQQPEETKAPRPSNPPKPPIPIPPIPPNLSLNLRPRPKRVWVRFAAALSVLLQSLVVLFAGLFAFRFKKDESQSKSFAFALLVSGTTLQCVGVAICAIRVCWSSKQEYWKPTKGYHDDKSKVRLIWLQKRQTVNDETYPACALEPKQEDILLSYTEEGQEENKYDTLVLVGVTLSLVGFILQFIGFRYLFWAVSVLQLGAMICTTLIRVFIQLPFSEPSKAHQLPERFELEWVISEIHGQIIWRPRAIPGKLAPRHDLFETAASANIFRSRIDLALMARGIGWELYYLEDADAIKVAIEAFLNTLWLFPGNLTPSAATIKEIRCPFNLNVSGEVSGKTITPDLVYLTARRERHPGGWGNWMLDVTEIEAFISLWLFYIKHKSGPPSEGEKTPMKTPDIEDRSLTDELIWAVGPMNPIASGDFDFWIRRSNHSVLVNNYDADSMSMNIIPEFLTKTTRGTEEDESRAEQNVASFGLRSPQCETGLNTFADSIPVSTMVLAMGTYSDWPKMCGRYIAANMTRHLLQFVQRINEPLSFRPGFDSECTFFENGFVTALAESLSATDLMNEQEALALIVPALRERDLLPTPRIAPNNPNDQNIDMSYVSFHACLRTAHALQLNHEYDRANQIYSEILESAGDDLMRELELTAILKEHAMLAAKVRSSVKDSDPHMKPLCCHDDPCEVVKLLPDFTTGQHKFLQAWCTAAVDCSSPSFYFDVHHAALDAPNTEHSADNCSKALKGEYIWQLYYLLMDKRSVGSLESLLDRAIKGDALEATVLLLMTISGNPSCKKLRRTIPGLLHWAVANDNPDMLKALLYYAPRPLATSQRQEHPLQVAISTKHYGSLLSLVDAGFDIESRSDDGNTALQFAAAMNDLEAVKILVDAKADIEAPVGHSAYSALSAAIENKNEEMAEYLLSHGALANPPMRWYGTPLSIAKQQTGSLEEILIKHGADPLAYSNLHWSHSNTGPAHEGNQGANIPELPPRAFNPFGTAFSPFPSLTTSRVHSVWPPPSFYSSEAGVASAKSKIFHWAKIQELAASGDEVKVAELIVKADPKAPAVALKGRTALQAAAENGHDAIVAMLLPVVDVNQARADIGGFTALEAAAANNNLVVAERLLLAGADVAAPAGNEGGTALQLACRYGHLEIVEFLIQNGAPVNAEGAAIAGFTALEAARLSGDEEIVKILKDNGAVDADD